MSSISRRRNGLMALSVIGAPVLGEVFAPRSQDRTPVSATLRDPSLATNYRGSGLVHRRNLVARGSPGEGRLTTHCCRFPHDTGWTAVDPNRSFGAIGLDGKPCPTLAIARSWLGSSRRKRTAIHSECRCYSMTSSARARIEDGTVRPSALAVWRLTTSSNVVGCWTRRSAGLAPARIR